MTRSGGRYVISDGEPVLIERSGHKNAPISPAPSAATQPVEELDDEDTQEAAAGRP